MMWRAPTFFLLLVAAAALVAADGKDDVKRATNSAREAIESLSKRYSNCANTPMGCKRDTEEQLRELSLHKDSLDHIGSSLDKIVKKSLKDKKEVSYRQLRDVKDAFDVKSLLKRTEDSVAKVHEVRAKDAMKNLKRDMEKSTSLKKIRDLTKTLKDSHKRFAELPWKRATDALGPMKRAFQKKAAMEKINRAKKHIREMKDVAKVNGLLKRATETLKQKRAQEKRATDKFGSLKRNLQMKLAKKEAARREVAEKTSKVREAMKRAQENVKRSSQAGPIKRMLDSFFAPAKRELKHITRAKMAKTTRDLKTNQLKDSFKRAVEKLTTKRDEVVAKRTKDVFAPMMKMRRELHQKAAVAKLRDVAENFKRAVRELAK